MTATTEVERRHEVKCFVKRDKEYGNLRIRDRELNETNELEASRRASTDYHLTNTLPYNSGTP